MNTITPLFKTSESIHIACPASPTRDFNSDQRGTFTSIDLIDRLKSKEIVISMDGRGRVHDNIFVERFWRSLKYEDIYLRDYRTPVELEAGVNRYFQF